MDDPFNMDGPRFFRLAQRLPYYEGAVRAVGMQLALKEGAAGGRGMTGVPAAPAGVLVNMPGKAGRGPQPVPEGARYTPGDRGSLMASPVFRDLIEFEKG